MTTQTMPLTSTQSARDTNRCLVCGFVAQVAFEEYDICPSCGTEFGVNDVNATIQDLRAAWLATGPTWWSPVDPRPSAWNPEKQLANVTGGDHNNPFVAAALACRESSTSCQASIFLPKLGTR